MGEDDAKRPRRATIADVAALAKVDRSVVSRLLNDDPRLSIRDSTRERVVEAINLLGYRPNAAARSLRTARTRTLGLFLPDFANPVYAEIIKGAERAAAEVGSVLVTGSARATAATPRAYFDLLGNGRVDGLLLATGGLREADEAELARLHLPWLHVNQRGPTGQRYVVLDDERAAAVAVDHLVELGHTRIAHIAGPRGTDSALRRRRGYTKAVRKLGSNAGPVIAADYTAEGGARAMATLLRAADPPTAVFVANVASAIGALHAAYEARIRIPDEVSVIAIHDLALAARLVPPLTTVRMPLDLLGARAVELLLGEEPEAKIAETVREPIELVVRESTAAPR